MKTILFLAILSTLGQVSANESMIGKKVDFFFAGQGREILEGCVGQSEKIDPATIDESSLPRFDGSSVGVLTGTARIAGTNEAMVATAVTENGIIIGLVCSRAYNMYK